LIDHKSIYIYSDNVVQYMHTHSGWVTYGSNIQEIPIMCYFLSHFSHYSYSNLQLNCIWWHWIWRLGKQYSYTKFHLNLWVRIISGC